MRTDYEPPHLQRAGSSLQPRPGESHTFPGHTVIGSWRHTLYTQRRFTRQFDTKHTLGQDCGRVRLPFDRRGWRATPGHVCASPTQMWRTPPDNPRRDVCTRVCNSQPRRGGLAKPRPSAWGRGRFSESSPEGATYGIRSYRAPPGLEVGNEIASYRFHPGRWPGLC